MCNDTPEADLLVGCILDSPCSFNRHLYVHESSQYLADNSLDWIKKMLVYLSLWQISWIGLDISIISH